MKILYIQLQIVAIVSLSQLSNTYSHGMGGSTLGYDLKNNTNKYKHDKKIESISERLSFTLEYQDNSVTLRARDDLKQVMDISLSSATVIISGEGDPSMLSMQPAQEGALASRMPTTISKDTKLEITLRLPGERPINISFSPMQSINPIRVQQQKKRVY